MNSVGVRIGQLFASRKIRYLFSGGISFVIEYALFAILTYMQLNLFVSNSLSFTTALVVSFVLHNIWSFSGEHKHGREKKFTAYILLAICNLILTNIIIGIAVNSLHVVPLAAKIFSMLIVITWNYVVMSRLIFRGHES